MTSHTFTNSRGCTIFIHSTSTTFGNAKLSIGHQDKAFVTVTGVVLLADSIGTTFIVFDIKFVLGDDKNI
jgi:hypothetical protein